MATRATSLATVRQTDFLPVTQFQGLGAATAVFDSVGAGDPVFQVVNSLNVNGLLMAAAADDVHHFMRIPTNWDRDHDIRVRIVYTTGSTTAADTIDWKFLYNAITPETAADTIIAPATALDTVIAQDTVHGTAYVVQKTASGILNGGTLTTEEYINFLCEMDAFAAGLTEDKLMLGVEFEYTLKLYKGRQTAAPVWANR